MIHWKHVRKSRAPNFQKSGFGLAGSAVYIVARKGKDLDLPAQTGMLVRMDNTITVPGTSAASASLTGSR